MTLDHWLQTLLNPSTDLRRHDLEVLGRNMWRVGLAIQAHRVRVEQELSSIKNRMKRCREEPLAEVSKKGRPYGKMKRRYRLWRVLSGPYRANSGHSMYRCQCVGCGTEKLVYRSALLRSGGCADCMRPSGKRGATTCAG